MNNIEALAGIVGKKGVITNSEALLAYNSDADYISGKPPVCAVKPKKAEEVQKIIHLANKNGVSLVPCSSNGPHTKGAGVPLVENAVVVDLSDMNAIVRIDKRNKVALVEPGVTFSELQEAATKGGLRVIMPLMPRKSKSVVESLLELEPTTVPKYHWDTSDPLCCMEVIFGEGSMFRTGSAAGPGTLEEQWAVGQAQKSPMGPAQSDLAKIVQGSQGTMGIVTWASVKLELSPTREKAFFVGADTVESLVDFTYAILKPRLTDVCLIVNRANVKAICSEEAAEDLPPWILFYSISGYEHFPDERIQYIEADIKDMAAGFGVAPVQTLEDISAQKILGLVTKPSGEPYWKSRVQGGFRDVFFLTTLDKAPMFVDAVRKEMETHQFKEESLGVYIQPIQQGRGCHMDFTLMYDPDDEGMSSEVKAWFQAVSKNMSELGGFFSRPYGLWSSLAYDKCPTTVTALKKVKGLLDPNGVMNPGKLCF